MAAVLHTSREEFLLEEEIFPSLPGCMVLGFVTIEIDGLQLLPKCAYDFLVNFSVWFKKFFSSIGINVELKETKK